MAKGQHKVITVKDKGDSYGNDSSKKGDANNHGNQAGDEGNHGNTLSGWEGFTQETTLHGIRFIFLRSHHAVRRVLWSVFVLTSMSLFVIQVSYRIRDYYRYESYVNIDHHQVPEVEMPAVTLCNHNRYRITAAASEGVYPFLNEYYLYQGDEGLESIVNKYKDNLPKDYESLISLVGHHQDDFIEGCLWRGKKCPADVFTSSFTDMGLCYTFNGGQTPLNVTDTGSNRGLRLFLNVEQYEHMQGPVGDAGVKILLHEPDEAPLMEDLGFSAAPGKHTLVSLKRTEVQKLGQPYGKCIHNVQSLATCKAGRWTKDVVNQCGCGVPQHRNITQDTSRLCSVSEMFTCVGEIYGYLNGTTEEDCHIPCRSVSYDPTISFAELSAFGIESLVLRNKPNRREHISNKYLNAMEVKERVDPSRRERNEKDMERKREKLEEIRALGKEVLKIYNSTNATAEHYHVGDIMKYGEQSVVQLASEMTSSYPKLTAQNVNSFYLHVKNLMDMVSGVVTASEQLLVNQTNHDTGLGACERVSDNAVIDDYLSSNTSNNSVATACWDYISIVRNATYRVLNREYDTSGKSLGSYGEKNDKADCINDKALTLKASQLSFWALLTDYRGNITAWYNATYQDPTEIQGHVSCIASLIDATTSATLRSIDLVVHFMKQIHNSTSFTDFKRNVFRLNETARQTGLLDDGFEGRLNTALSSCTWMAHYNHMCKGDQELAAKYNSYISNMALKTDMFARVNQDIRDFIPDLQTFLTRFDTISTLINSTISAYEEKHITKLDLARYFTTFAFRRKLKDFEDIAVGDLEDEFVEVEEAAETLCTSVREIFSYLAWFKIPLLNDKMLLKSNFFNDIFMESTREDIRSYIRRLTSDHTDYLEKIVNAHCDPYTENLANYRKVLEENSEELFEDEFNSFLHDLEEYQRLANTNSAFYLKNFLQVDIYYRELRYERIVHQPSFGILSLFSEVGGFLGLLLGGSVLTLCELLDFLMLSFLTQVNANKSARKPRVGNKLNPISF